jgi:tRNA 2-selenouridine synthase SelU
MAEKTTQNNEGQQFQDEMLIEENYRSKSSMAGDTKKYQQRVAYLENLLSANLDNLTSSQKYYEAEQAKKAQSLKWF